MYKHSKIHHVVGKYEYNEDTEDMVLKVMIKWNHKLDRNFLKLVEEGLKDPVNTDKKAEKDYLYLRRGVFLSESQVDMIYFNLETILQYSFYNQDSKKIVLQFIEHILSKPKLKSFVQEKLKDYEGMKYQSKMKLIKDILVEMFQDKKNDGILENPENEQSYSMKTYMDCLNNKIALVFSLLNHHLKQ